MKFITVNASNFEGHKNKLVNLYINTFSLGKSFQYHSAEETAAYLRPIFEKP